MFKIFVGMLFVFASSLGASERLFTYTEEADVLPKGAMEFEQWVTNRNGKAEGVYSRWDLRSELEFGLNESLTSSIYLNLKSEYASVHDLVLDMDINSEEFAFEGLSSEWKYLVLSPLSSPVGILLYGELSYNGPEFEPEVKLVLQHNFGESAELAINAIVENEYVFEASKVSVEGKMEFDAGLSFQIVPSCHFGFEVRNQRIWPDWTMEASSAWFAGPALHVAGTKAWMTLSLLPQFAGQPVASAQDSRDLTEHERVETRLIVGLNF